MTREEVLALSDVKLNEMALGLLPRTARIDFSSIGWDPTHDIAAAWELWPLISVERANLEALHLVRVPRIDTDRFGAAIGYGFSVGEVGGPSQDEWEYRPLALEEPRPGEQESVTSARAITRAFVFAMTQEG